MKRLWDKIKVGEPDECWPWQAYKNPAGYGMISWHDGVPKLAHRVAWEQVNGEIPEGMGVLHRCDNPPCCNPRHLFLGDQSANMRDCANKGRHKYGTAGQFKKKVATLTG